MAEKPSSILQPKIPTQPSSFVSEDSGTESAKEGKRRQQQQQKEEILELTKGFRKALMDKIGREWKASFLADPDMWEWTKRAVGEAFDNVWADLEHELEKNLRFAVAPKGVPEDAEGPSGDGCRGCWCRFRAFVLSHYLPYNKSIFGKLKDPLYLLVFILSSIPLHGLRVAVFGILLCMLCYPGPPVAPDKYQAVNFIILFKCTQFWSSGLVAMAVGSAKYFSCYSWHKDALSQCIERNGPGANETFGQLFDYLGNIVLVWIAFDRLNNLSRRDSPERDQSSTEIEQGDRNAASRLKSLMQYDVACFEISIAMLVVLTIMTGIPSIIQVQANVYWCCVAYSLLGVPFLPFLVPSFLYLLMHVDPTGFNRKGACVEFEMPVIREADQENDESHDLPPMFGMAHKLLKLAKLGGEVRGADPGEYKFGDVTRGVAASTGHRMKEMQRGLLTKIDETAFADMKSMGKEMRTGDAQSSYAFGDFSRGVYWKVFHGTAAPKEEKNVETNVGDAPPLLIASVTLPAEEFKEHKGTKYFRIDVCPQEGEHWFVFRRYRHFYTLCNKLGPRAVHEAEKAPFPGKRDLFTWGVRTQRRERLERWLSSIIHSTQAQGSPWAGLIREFLSSESEEYNMAIEDENENEASGGEDAFEPEPSAAEIGADLALSMDQLPEEPVQGKDHPGI